MFPTLLRETHQVLALFGAELVEIAEIAYVAEADTSRASLKAADLCCGDHQPARYIVRRHIGVLPKLA